MSAMTSKQL